MAELNNNDFIPNIEIRAVQQGILESEGGGDFTDRQGRLADSLSGGEWADQDIRLIVWSEDDERWCMWTFESE